MLDAAAGGEGWQTSAPPAVRVEQTERDMEREHTGGTADMLASPIPRSQRAHAGGLRTRSIPRGIE